MAVALTLSATAVASAEVNDVTPSTQVDVLAPGEQGLENAQAGPAGENANDNSRIKR